MIIRADLIDQAISCGYAAKRFLNEDNIQETDMVNSFVKRIVSYYDGKKVNKKKYMRYLNSYVKDKREYNIAYSIYKFFSRKHMTQGPEVAMYSDKDPFGKRKYVAVAHPVLIPFGSDVKVSVNVTYSEKKYSDNDTKLYLDMYIFNNVCESDIDVINYWPIAALIYDTINNEYHSAVRIFSYNYETGTNISVSVNKKVSMYIVNKVKTIYNKLIHMSSLGRGHVGCYRCEYRNMCWEDFDGE